MHGETKRSRKEFLLRSSSQKAQFLLFLTVLRRSGLRPGHLNFLKSSTEESDST